MGKGTTFVALDDSKRKIVAGILRPGATEPELCEIPNEPRLVRRLIERVKREGPVQICYEAGVSGYALYRQITGLGVPCQVIAPALTPRRPGQRIKTDKRDARKLVRLFRAGELTAIHVPDEAEEGVRDLLRCREAVRRDVVRWRHRVVTFLDRHGRRYLPARTGRTGIGPGSGGNSSPTPRCSAPWTRPSSRSSKPWGTRPSSTRCWWPWRRRHPTGSPWAGSAASVASTRSRP